MPPLETNIITVIIVIIIARTTLC